MLEINHFGTNIVIGLAFGILVFGAYFTLFRNNNDDHSSQNKKNHRK